MDVRWKLGVFLRHTATTGEHDVGARNGDVLRSRSCVRVVEPSRWDRSALDRVTGIPGALKSCGDGQLSPDDIASAENPHGFAADEVDPVPKEDAPAPREADSSPRERREEMSRRKLRILERILTNMGQLLDVLAVPTLTLGIDYPGERTAKHVANDSMTYSRPLMMLSGNKPPMKCKDKCHLEAIFTDRIASHLQLWILGPTWKLRQRRNRGMLRGMPIDQMPMSRTMMTRNLRPSG